jgi:hypothetical protein
MVAPNTARATLGALGQYALGQEIPAFGSMRRRAGHGELGAHRKPPVRPIWDRQRELDARGEIRQEPAKPDVIAPRPDAGKLLEAQITPFQVTPRPPALPKRCIALLQVTEADDCLFTISIGADTLQGAAFASIEGEARCKEEEDKLNAAGGPITLAAMRARDADTFVGMALHLGADDDEDTLALLLEDEISSRVDGLDSASGGVDAEVTAPKSGNVASGQRLHDQTDDILTSEGGPIVLAALRRKDTDSFVGLTLHLGTDDDDEEALELLLDEE